MDANKRPRVDVTYRRFKHGRGFTWHAVVDFKEGGGAQYPASGRLAAVSRWVATQAIEDRYPSQEVACFSEFEFSGGRADASAVQRSVARLATVRDEATREEAASALRTLGVTAPDAAYVLEVVGMRVGTPADLNGHSGADAVGRPWLRSITGQVMERWRVAQQS